MGPPSQTSLCIVSSLPLIDILCPLHAKSICTYQDLISPTQSEFNPTALISPIAITPLTDPFDRSQRSLPHNGSPRHWLLNPVPLKILTDPSKSVFYTHCQARWKWDSNLDLGVMGRRQQKLDSFLGLGVLRWRGDSRSVKPSCGSRGYVNGVEECGFHFLLSKKRREKEWTNTEEQREYKMYSLSWIKKLIFHTGVSFFLKSNTHIPNTILCFLNIETCYLNHDTKHILLIYKH